MKSLKQYKIKDTNTGNIVAEKPLKLGILDNKDDAGKAANLFFAKKTGKHGKYVAVENALVYRTILKSKRSDDFKVSQNIIAIRLSSGLVLGNASILPLIGRNVSFGRESLNSNVSAIQTRLGQVIPMLPFDLFQETGLSLSKVRIIDQGPEETVKRMVNNPDYEYGENIPEMIEETAHFTGSKLFETDGIQFLFDIDRIEIKNKIFNPFLAKLPKQVSNIAQAYESLKPDEVLDAEKKGIEVLRQGEWFLIKSNESPDNPNANNKSLKKSDGSWDRFELRAGSNRPNYATFGFKIGNDSFVSGLMEHSGREHAPLKLKGWYKVVPNTAIESFQISGRVD